MRGRWGFNSWNCMLACNERAPAHREAGGGHPGGEGPFREDHLTPLRGFPEPTLRVPP